MMSFKNDIIKRDPMSAFTYKFMKTPDGKVFMRILQDLMTREDVDVDESNVFDVVYRLNLVRYENPKKLYAMFVRSGMPKKDWYLLNEYLNKFRIYWLRSELDNTTYKQFESDHSKDDYKYSDIPSLNTIKRKRKSNKPSIKRCGCKKNGR